MRRGSVWAVQLTSVTALALVACANSASGTSGSTTGNTASATGTSTLGSANSTGGTVASSSGTGSGATSTAASVTAGSASGNAASSNSSTTGSSSSGGVTIDPGFFCLNINKTDPWPFVHFGAWRTLNSSINWADLNPDAGSYDWTRLDKGVLQAVDAGVEIVYTIYETPSWASECGFNSNCVDAGYTFCGSDLTGFVGPGWCYPPADIYPDGGGTDQHLIGFLNALLDHLEDAGESESVTTYEIWNEPNITSEWHGLPAQLVRIADDVKATISARQPSAKFTTPPFTELSYLHDGGIPNPTVTAGFVEGYLSDGGPALDVIAFHGYLNFGYQGFYYEWPPETEAVQIADLRAVEQQYGLVGEPLWDTEEEPGWDMLSDGGGSDPFNANPDVGARIATMARTYFVEMALGVARHCWFSWSLDDGVFDLYNYAGDGGLTAVGVAYQQIYAWTVGKTFTAPCGPVSAGATQWSCPLTGPAGYQAELLWDTAGVCDGGICRTTSTTVSSAFVDYQDLAGHKVALGDGGAPVGSAPILLEN